MFYYYFFYRKLDLLCYWFSNGGWGDKRHHRLGSAQVYRPVKRRCFCCDACYHLWPSFPSFFPSSLPTSFSPISRLPDPLHAYLGLCGLSLIGEPSLRKVHAALNITQRAFQHLQQLQQTWKDSTGSCSRQHWQRDDPQRCLWTGSVTVVSQRQLDSCFRSGRCFLAPLIWEASSFPEPERFFFFKTPVTKSNTAELILSDFSVEQYTPHLFFWLPFY